MFQDIIQKNHLQYQYIDEAHNVKLLLNKANVILLQNELIKIVNEFNDSGIEYIAFKGAILANRLYDNIYTRFFSDIDVFVFPQHFEKALDVLYNNGYVLRYPNILSNPHHTALKNGKIVVELHKNILNPFTEINESYMYDHTEIFDLSKQNVITFDTTATLLHLFYHLYMDTNGAYKSFYSLFENGTLPKAERFLYRAYEIALFSEKYRSAVKWDDIINDLKKQPLRIFFKQMISDIDRIFNGALPEFFIKAVNQLNYKENITDELVYKPFINFGNKFKEENRQKILCKYIQKMRFLLGYKNKSLNIGEEDSIKSPDESSNLRCNMKTEKYADGIKFVFKVCDNDILTSRTDEYNTVSSDGVHLVLFNPAPYFYKSIFFFPKRENDGRINVKVCDVLSEPYLLKRDIISADFDLTDDGYVITAFLTSEFLKSGNIENEVYFNYMISDCDAHTGQRRETLLPMDSIETWYDPSYFIKLNL